MFALPTRAGSICGWSPSNDSNDTLYTTATTSTAYSLHACPSLPLASTPRAARNPIPRSLSLDSSVRARSLSDATDTSSTYTPYHNPTSTRRYKLKRQLDPSWAPRPPNAFILFRRDYVEKHKGENSVSDPKEKTLSKRAGDAWKALTADDKKPWFEKAKVEAMKHAAANPNYVYRPKKPRSEPRRHPALLSRREQVEEFVRKATRRRAISAHDRRPASRNHYDCPTPGSVGSSSSPEPPGTPSSEESNPFANAFAVSQSQSQSRATHLEIPIPMPPPPRAYMSQSAMNSMPSLVSDRPLAPKRSFSYSDMPPYVLTEYINFGDEYSESDDQSIFSFDSAISEPSPMFFSGEPSEQSSPVGCEITLQNPEGQYIPEPQLVSDPRLMPEPQAMPAAVDPLTTMLPPASSSSSSGVYPLPPPSPLFERRRRAATISTLPSPLTVITSSLSGWARDDLVTARMVPRAEPSQPSSLTHPHLSAFEVISDSGDPWVRSMAPDVHPGLAATIPEADMEITPRVPDFPQNISSTGMPPPLGDPTAEFSMPEPQEEGLPMPMLDPYDITADLECYSLGLRQYRIGNGGAEAANYGIPPFEVDYSSFLSCEGSREQA
ncbi:hypothetical protein C8Q73DRAFT_792979 [Cubamyces lactineus]|nr:hypothetical protein C8Q73DRAFT_792979 [Cubamyces lactineus]